MKEISEIIHRHKIIQVPAVNINILGHNKYSYIYVNMFPAKCLLCANPALVESNYNVIK